MERIPKLEQTIRDIEQKIAAKEQRDCETHDAVLELRAAILGDLSGFKGLREKADYAYETVRVLAVDHKELRVRVDNIEIKEGRKIGIAMGISSVIGAFIVKCWDWIVGKP